MSTTDQVATLQSVQDKVKERIEATFMELLPPELFQGMVSKALDDFIKYELPKLVQTVATEYFAAALKAEFSKPAWTEKWMGNGMVPGELVSAIVKAGTNDLVNALFGQIVQSCVSYLRNSNGVPRY